jgi:pimeloyl-ACP methyl ester carboxylesterase
MLAEKTPRWMFRAIIDLTSRAIGHGAGGIHSLPEHIRAQTALDYTRTAPGVYNIPNTMGDLMEYLPTISLPTLVVWGELDQTLSPNSFSKLVNEMPRAEGKSFQAGHVPHQSNAEEFNGLVTEFLKNIAL